MNITQDDIEKAKNNIDEVMSALYVELNDELDEVESEILKNGEDNGKD